MLDIHTHILPRIDDGSKSVQQSLAMLQMEKMQGIDQIALTPHFYADRESPERFLKRRLDALNQLNDFAQQNPLPKLSVGAEVAFFTGMSHADGIENLCIGDTNAMLIEMPFCKWNRSIVDELIYFRECRGIQPILAHIERYIAYQPMGAVRELNESGLRIQANASFFIRWRKSWLAMRMLRRREIQFIGSDCHNTSSRPPNMEAAIIEIDKRIGKKAMEYLQCMERRLSEGELI